MMLPRPMKDIAPTMCRIAGIRLPSGCEGTAIEPVVEEIGRPSSLCLLVIDSLGMALWKRLEAAAPHLTSMASRGLVVLEAEPPPTTAVNLATMATGVQASSHRVKKKEDPLLAETIFDVMQKCALKTALASQREGVLAALFTGKTTWQWCPSSLRDEAVLELVLKEMKARRPDFLWMHFVEVDRAAHRHGPESPECEEALASTDRLLGELTAGLAAFSCALLVAADHGHHGVPEGAQKGIHDGSDPHDMAVPLVWRKAPT
ncbi:MAG: alkaline phosphatase family protein [Candidatus Eremiobacteraeota bacterium]|nr:alkaline phosphatase family protein [Candidatus Eremiobacteraeota bacterium]